MSNNKRKRDNYESQYAEWTISSLKKILLNVTADHSMYVFHFTDAIWRLAFTSEKYCLMPTEKPIKWIIVHEKDGSISTYVYTYAEYKDFEHDLPIIKGQATVDVYDIPPKNLFVEHLLTQLKLAQKLYFNLVRGSQPSSSDSESDAD